MLDAGEQAVDVVALVDVGGVDRDGDDEVAAAVGRVDATLLSVGILAGLAALSYLFAGPSGVIAYLAAGVVGLVPARFRARRAALMGVLFGPLLVG